MQGGAAAEGGDDDDDDAEDAEPRLSQKGDGKAGLSKEEMLMSLFGGRRGATEGEATKSHKFWDTQPVRSKGRAVGWEGGWFGVV